MKKLTIIYGVALIILASALQANEVSRETYEHVKKIAVKPVPSSLAKLIRSKDMSKFPADKEITIKDVLDKITSAYNPILVGGILTLDTQQARQDGFSFKEDNKFIPEEIVIIPSLDPQGNNGIFYEYGVVLGYDQGFVKAVSVFLTPHNKLILMQRKYPAKDIGKWAGE